MRSPRALLALCVPLAVAACSAGDSDESAEASGSALAIRNPIGGTGPIIVGPKWPPFNPPVPPPPPPIVIGDANDPATILADADILWNRYFASAGTDESAIVTEIGTHFTESAGYPVATTPPYWDYAQKIGALVQMYDLLAPIDQGAAMKYLDRLHSFAKALADNKDDVRNFPADAFRDRVMPAWGAYTLNRDDRWNTDVVTAGAFTYAMTSFARRVADNPSLFSAEYSADAIRFTTSALDTYEAFRRELYLVEGDAQAYFTVPSAYQFLTCSNGASGCEDYRDTAGQPIAWNENFSMMTALAETALAANSPLYRASADATPFRLYRATYEAPLLIAKDFTFFDQNLRQKTLSDGTRYFEWNHQLPLPRIQDVAHGGFELGSLAVLLDDKYALDQLLIANGRTEQVALSTPLFTNFASTFLRKIWHYDYQESWGLRNVLDKKIDGSSNPTELDNDNIECAGWIPLAQFNPWVWTRCRDATLHDNDNRYLRVDNHAALLRYRQYH